MRHNKKILFLSFAVVMGGGIITPHMALSQTDVLNIVDGAASSEPLPSGSAEVPAPLSSETKDVVSPAPSSPDLPPSEAKLTPEVPTPSMGDVADTVEGTNVMGAGGVQPQHSGTYYDADALVPDSALEASGAVGPRKVDPAYEVGQKFIVVEKSHSAGSYEAQYVAASRALKLGRYAAAMEIFEGLYSRNHKDPRVILGLAISQQGAGFKESAAHTYEDLLRVQPNNADAIINLMGLMSEQYPSVTMSKLEALRDKYPTNPGVPAQMAMVSAEMKKYDDALRYLEVAASMEPTNPSHIYNMAIINDRAGKTAKAIDLYEESLQLDSAHGGSVNALPRESIYDRLVVLRRKI